MLVLSFSTKQVDGQFHNTSRKQIIAETVHATFLSRRPFMSQCITKRFATVNHEAKGASSVERDDRTG